MGPYNILGSTLQAAPWAHLGVMAASFRQLHGPYNIFGSMAHPGVLAECY